MRAVIFDVAGVLIAWKPKLLYAKLVPDADLREYFLAEVSRAPWEDKPVRQGAFEEGLRRLAERSPNRAKLLAERHAPMVRDMLEDLMGPVATLMQRLTAQGVGLFGTTGLTPHALAQVRQLYPSTLDQLGGMVVAAEVGLAPTDPAMFEHTLRLFGLRAEHCLYVDESETNALAAESVGIAAHRYTWITPLRRELRARGFLPIPPVLLPKR